MPPPTRAPIDGFPTPTSKIQSETEQILINHLPDHRGPPSLHHFNSPDFEKQKDQDRERERERPPAYPYLLQKQSHMGYLARNLRQGFPAKYISQDASQPWLMFWTLHSLGILQVGLDPGNKQRAIDTIMTWQHPDGGFGGGPGQSAHLLPTYAAICALAIVGRPGPRGGWDQIDRTKLYNFFMSLKQKDGSFLVALNAEVDVRGIYCLLVVATLLNIATPALLSGVPEFISSCQTYEGGFASASQPYYNLNGELLSHPRPPLGEAHGGYTFCALASWVLLKPYLDLSYAPASGVTERANETQEESESMPRTPRPSINDDNLLRWLVQMQGSDAELGGFKGRTNKLVDGCYSWWVGGAFALLEAVGAGHGHDHGNAHPEEHVEEGKEATHTGEGNNEEEESWIDVDDTLFNREALQEYILFAGQHPAGGLRDKPPKSADAYHTLYCLSGLSAAQHHVLPSPLQRQRILDFWVPLQDQDDDLRQGIFSDALCWQEDENMPKSVVVGGEANRLNATHPLFNLTMTHTQGIMRHFYGQSVPPFRTTPLAKTQTKGGQSSSQGQ